MSTQYIVTLDQLVSELPTVATPEETDALALCPLSYPSSLLYPLRMWADVGFPSLGNLAFMTLHSPSPSPDGTPRTMYEYISFLTGQDLDQAITNINAQLPGITVSYIISGNTLQLCASTA